MAMGTMNVRTKERVGHTWSLLEIVSVLPL